MWCRHSYQLPFENIPLKRLGMHFSLALSASLSTHWWASYKMCCSLTTFPELLLLKDEILLQSQTFSSFLTSLQLPALVLFLSFINSLHSESSFLSLFTIGSSLDSIWTLSSYLLLNSPALESHSPVFFDIACIDSSTLAPLPSNYSSFLAGCWSCLPKISCPVFNFIYQKLNSSFPQPE